MSDLFQASAEEQPTALTVIPAALVSTIIAADENDILGKLSAKVREFQPDASTPRGRKEIASLAAEVATSKMDLIRLGKSMTESWRKSTAAVNAECKIIEERMDALKTQVREPLTKIENEDRDRIAGHEAALIEMVEAPGYGQTETAAEIEARITWLMDYPDRDWREFRERAKRTMGNELDRLAGLLAAAQKREAEAADLARLRAAEAEQQRLAEIEAQRRREEQIAADAAAEAKAKAEAQAAEVASAAQRVLDAERAKLARAEESVRLMEKQEQERQRISVERAEITRKAEVDREERNRLAAEEQTRNAVMAEQQRAADAKAAEDKAAAKRAANIARQRQVHLQIASDLIALGIPDEHARAAVIGIAKGKVRHVSIEY